MDALFWKQRWEEGRTGFHRDTVHEELVSYLDTVSAGPLRILVPLCGKTLDLHWLAEQGHEVVGIELSSIAVQQLHEAHGRVVEPVSEGPFSVWRSPGLTIYVGDVFDATPDQVGQFDLIWDRAALIALDPPRRRRYATLLRTLVRPAGRILLNHLFYDQSQMDGPPHSVPPSELTELYPGWTSTVRSEVDVFERNPKFRERLDALWGATRVLERPS